MGILLFLAGFLIYVIVLLPLTYLIVSAQNRYNSEEIGIDHDSELEKAFTLLGVNYYKHIGEVNVYENFTESSEGLDYSKPFEKIAKALRDIRDKQEEQEQRLNELAKVSGLKYSTLEEKGWTKIKTNKKEIK